MNWVQTPLDNRWVLSLAADGSNIFAGTQNTGVYHSTNEGADWTQTSLNNQSINAMAISGNNIFAGANISGVYISTNYGLNWTQTSLNNMTIRSFAVNSNTVIAGTFQQGVYVSSNNGINWIQRNEGLGNAVVYSLCIINNYIFAGTLNSIFRRPLSDLTGFNPISNEAPNQFSLSQNYPNPFNPSTKIEFDIPKSSYTKLVIYDITGREIQTLVNDQLNAGTYSVDFDGSKLSSGIYFYKLVSGDYVDTKKMILVK